MKFGLDNQLLLQLNSIFAKFQLVDSVILYGSRAKGNYGKSSDIDLTLVGSAIPYQLLIDICWEIDELLTPYCFDISIFSDIENEALVEHIQRVGVIIYQK